LLPKFASVLREENEQMARHDVPYFYPETTQLRHSELQEFIRICERQTGKSFRTYPDFEKFALKDFRTFWKLFLDRSGIGVAGDIEPVCDGNEIETAKFFPNLRLNYAKQLLHGDDDRPALIAYNKAGQPMSLTRGALRGRVQRVAGGLRKLGIGSSDRAVAIAYSDANAVIACLASAAVGASFSTAAPEMEAPATLARFQQLQPTILFTHVEQRSGNHLQTVVPAVIAGLPSLRWVVALDEDGVPVSNVPTLRLTDLTEEAPLDWQDYAFNHPLFILFSSGTTGAPKCIVHGAGGTLLEHTKELRLHCDLKPGEQMLFQTSCAWMMWNWQLSALACRATIILYDRPITHPSTLWSLIAQHHVNVFGTNPAYLKMCESAGYVPINHNRFEALRAILSTGSILHDAQYDWVIRQVKRLPIQSISGGTDIIGCFVLGNPLLPVWRGEAQCRSLGLDVAAADDTPIGEIGELVCRNPFPSRPLGFFGDPAGCRFHDAYFSQHPGIWTHGDRISFTSHGTARLHGRSDGVLNVRGIRIGTAEIYASLQDIPELLDVMAIEQELPDTPAGGRIVLLVVLPEGMELTNELVLRLRRQIAQRTAAVYVPGAILAVSALPTTHSGKRSETAARDALNGRPVRNSAALRNPECLAEIAGHPGLNVSFDAAILAGERSTRDILTAIWCSTFGLQFIGPDDNFFDLGGDSLMAMAICISIEEKLCYHLPISMLFQHPTIAELAQVFEGGGIGQGENPLVVLREGSQRPIFILHSVSGSIFEWYSLLARLRTNRSIVAIQARGLDPQVPPSQSVPEMATDYSDLIRRHQANGPYTLMGYSFGGLLAYEIAIRLRQMGFDVDFIGLIDTNVQAGALPVGEWLSFYIERAKHLCSRIASLQLGGSVKRLMQKMAGREAGSMQLPPILSQVRYACQKAFYDYDPPEYDGTVTFFRSPERRPHFCDPLLIWRRRATEVRVIDVLGGHISMMREPDVVPLAEKIAECVDLGVEPSYSLRVSGAGQPGGR
jgi:acetoacetyl-CoA synthetase